MPSTSEVERIQRELGALHVKHAGEAKKLAALAHKIAGVRSSITRTTSTSMVSNKLGEIQRLEREAANCQKRQADLAGQIAKSTERLHKAQLRLETARTREQSQAIESLARRQESLRIIQSRALASLALREEEVQETVKTYDAFISHASEDKDSLVRPLAEKLGDAGFSIWFDEMELTVGDSLRRSIDRGLAASRFGIVVLSPSFLAKNWPRYELDGLVAREIQGGAKVILPLWHKVSKDEILEYSPPLADKVALNTATHSTEQLVVELARVLRHTTRTA